MEAVSVEIFIKECSKCKHNTPQTFRRVQHPASGNCGVFDLEDIGRWDHEGSRARQCLVCGCYFKDVDVSAEEKLSVIKM